VAVITSKFLSSLYHEMKINPVFIEKTSLFDFSI
jgi:hypothetical protein